MKKKFMRGIAAFLAAVMMLPTAAFAETTEGGGDGSEPAVVDTTPGEGTGEGTGSGTGEGSGEGTGEGEPTPPQEATSISISLDKNKIYDGGSNKTATVTLTAEGGTINDADIIWYSTDKDVATVSGSGKTATVTGVSEGTASIKALYGDLTSNVVDIEVDHREIINFKVEETKKIDLHYYTGQSFNTEGIKVSIKYNDDNTWKETTDYTVSPSGAFTEKDPNKKVTIAYPGTTFTHDIYVEVEQIEVESVTIVEPKNNAEVEKGKSLDSVTVKVVYNNGDDEEITATKVAAKGVTLNGYTLGTVINADVSFTASYGGKTSSPVIVKAKAAAAKTIVDMYVYTKPTKLTYNVNDTLDLTGLVLAVKYSDNPTQYLSKTYANNSSKITSNISKLTTKGTQTITLTYADAEAGTATATFDVTVGSVANVTGLKTSSSYYELEEDVEIKVGDKLNDDIMWYDVFKEVYLVVDGSRKLIDSKSDLEDYPGVELLLKVYNKTTDSDLIEAKNINSDGEVRLQLYVKVGGTSITSTSTDKSILVYVDVQAAECTVSIYSSKTYTSSSYLKATKTFKDFEDALEALKDEDEIDDVFDISLGSNYAIRIKFGEDQELSSNYEFEPDYENPIYIDLNGCELKLPSDWIVYDDCEDLVVTITNTNDDDYGKLVYRDKSVSLIVAEGSMLEFSEDEIPMDSDAAVTMTIYRSSSSSTKIAEKIYDDLEEALEALEDHDDTVDAFDISSSYEDSFVVKIKLGEDEDQDITDFTFAPDYDTTISIDLNGNKLELDSDWIDFDECEDLVVKINNTHEDDKASLIYDDKDITLTIAKGDSALEFKEDEIPGIYDITIGSMTNGKATMSKDTVGHGGSVKFTITPNSGYAIDTVKINNKTVSSSNYTVDSKGVGTYELKDIVGDAKLDVTFKKASTTTTEKEESKPSSSTTTSWTNPFTDVSKNAQYYDAVAFVCSEGLFNGMTATKFEPTTTMTRAMFVTVLGRLAGVDPQRYSGTSFTDVSKTDQQISWAAPYIEWAVQNGITQGTGNGKFSPNDPITHQQMYLFMYRYAMFIENITTSVTNVKLTGIQDASQIADWALTGVKFASAHKILITSGGKLTPTDNALRCELAMLLHGFCVKVLGYND